MKVKKWISYDEARDYPSAPCGGLGGFFNFNQSGMRWKDYVNIFIDESKLYLEAIRESILENDIWFTGQDHQQSKTGVPLFEDNTVATFSYRGWGDLMAAIRSEKEDRDYNYMDFYM